MKSPLDHDHISHILMMYPSQLSGGIGWPNTIYRVPPPSIQLPASASVEAAPDVEMTREQMVEALADVVVELGKPAGHHQLVRAVSLIASCLAKELGGADTVRAKLAAENLSEDPPRDFADIYTSTINTTVQVNPPPDIRDLLSKEMSESIARALDRKIIQDRVL